MPERTVSNSLATPMHAALAGRQDQLSAAAAALTDPRYRGAAVVAPAGMGKTALLRAVMAAEQARFRFFPLAAGAAAGMGVPFAALTPMLSYLPAGGPPTAADVLRTVEAFIGAAAPARRRPVVVVDDADELDGGSASVIARLAAAGTVRLLVSVRPGAGSHSGAAALIRDGLLREIGLAPLSGDERDELCRTVLGATVISSSVRALGEASGGNPRLLGLLLQEARDTGSLVPRNGTWLLAEEPRRAARPCWTP
ncbi:ATP-binding protein [Arthrobacter mobilis]|uniref:ATP-binding protein n=1 Tax=Arthrobacter mobilis TaxID=2724944 RepID=A0A7X6HA89_9MICC|nr:ATP-binding protein [Arthrobacter mobilis]NKX53326.1 ATP-binding protein [Arthrobacter mobilis]